MRSKLPAPECHPRLQEPKIDPAEKQRLKNLMVYERKALKNGFTTIAGIDEAGRGPLAGPVVAAACIIPKNMLIPGVDDSKKLSPKKRLELFEWLTTQESIIYGVGIVHSEEIDQINILQATLQAMLKAVANLSFQPNLLLVDGRTKVPHPTIPCEVIIGGDGKSIGIASASIIAKETRDRLMLQYHERWPQYGFDQHKGYGTEFHLEALAKYGPCEIHRRSFAPVKSAVIGAPVQSNDIIYT